MDPYDGNNTEIETWQSLVHVCRRWRGLVLELPRRLNLRLLCTPGTPARDALDIWPALPLIVVGSSMAFSSGTDNVIAALGQSNRVSQVDLHPSNWQLEEVLAAMQVPLPELTDLLLWSDDETLPVICIPDSFLNGSAPRLRLLLLFGIPFPGLPKLLLSTTHLVQLRLADIPHSGYISPEAILALLSVLSSLEIFYLGFRSPQSRPDRESRSPKRSILPALYYFHFKGVTEYLEDFVARIDTPRLKILGITFFNQIDFDCPRLARFINCTPTLKTRDEAHILLDESTASVELGYWTSNSDFYGIQIKISCRGPVRQLSSIEQVCNSSFSLLSTVEDLHIEYQCWEIGWKDDTIENTSWLQLLLPFIAVKNLYLSEEFAPGITAALQELVGDRMAEVLPSLQNIFVKGTGVEPSRPFLEKLEQFIDARQLSDHPNGHF